MANIMKKVFKINTLFKVLTVVVFCTLPFFSLHVKNAIASAFNIDLNNSPVKRPIDLASLQESSDTIYNMTQKVGAKLTTEIKKTTLKKK